MIRRGILATTALLLVGPQTLSAQSVQPLQLAPSSPWALDYADDSCRLVRTFGSGAEEVTLGLTSYAPGGMFQVSAVGDLTRTFRTPPTVNLKLGDVEDYDVRFFQVDFGGRPGILITNPITVGPLPEAARREMESQRPVGSFSDPAVEAQVTTIGFLDGFEQKFELRTGSLREPMAALKDCTADLVTHWDIDTERHAGLSRIAVPRTPPFRWIDIRDYPRDLRNSTMINYRLIIDENGQVAGCHIAGADQASPFAVATCEQLTENARFDAALDAEGNPVRSYFVTWYEMIG